MSRMHAALPAIENGTYVVLPKSGAAPQMGAKPSASDMVATINCLSGIQQDAAYQLIGAIGTGLYCAWQAYATDDENLTLVEYWLDNGVFGSRS